MVGLFQGEYYGDVEELDAAGSAAKTKGTKYYGEDPCLLMLSFGREICDTQLRVAAAQGAAISRRKVGKATETQEGKRGKKPRRRQNHG